MVRGSMPGYLSEKGRMAQTNGIIDQGTKREVQNRRQLQEHTLLQSPRTVRRLTAVSNQLHKMAIANNGLSRTTSAQDRKKGTIFQNWTTKTENGQAQFEDTTRVGQTAEGDTGDEVEIWSNHGQGCENISKPALKGILHVHDGSPGEEGCNKPKKHVRISELRRGSLTGSLPDLTKASDADLEQSGALAEACKDSPQLPEGSEAFQMAMRDLGDDDDDHEYEEEKGTASKPKVGFTLHDLKAKSKGNTTSNNKLINRFRSRTAEVICVNRLIITYPKYMERLQGAQDCSDTASAPQSPTTSKTFKQVHWGELDVADMSELMRKARSVPTTPRSDLSPNTTSDAKCSLSTSPVHKKASNLRCSQELTSSASPTSPNSPSAQTSPRNLRKCHEKTSPLCRANSLGASAASPRLLKRKQTTAHKLLSRTRSNDA